jgi:uncharacterized lipoprotein
MRTVAGVLVVAALSGCASMKNTPQQDATWKAYSLCQYEGRIPNNVQMVRVEPDGRYWYEWINGSRGSTDLEQCIREKVAAIAAEKRAASPKP